MNPGSIPKPLTIPPMPKTAAVKANEDSTLPPLFERVPDLIDRAQAQVAVQCAARRYKLSHIHHGEGRAIWSEDLILMSDAMDALREIPPAEPEYMHTVMLKIKEKYEKAMNTPCISNPMAWALYQTWKEYDR